jgi:beta-glucuronidase
MHRRFRTTTRRQVQSLGGVWDFHPDPEDVGVTEGWYQAFPQASDPMWVPGVWNTLRPFLQYEGPAWLRTRFTIDKCRALAIRFAAVTHQANVWLDGEPLGEHYGGFLPFGFVVLEPEAGEHELVVRVDNTHDSQYTIPSDNLDWFRYGGIPRPVHVELFQGTAYIDTLRVTPIVNGAQFALNVRSELVSLGDEPEEMRWTLWVDDRRVRSGTVTLEPGEAQVLMFGVDLEAMERWSPENPRLYTVRLELGDDDLIERTGFRDIRVQGQRVLLNGEPLRIVGVNRHEDHPDWGLALPEHLMLRDLWLLEDWGGNSIRGSHYPNDQRFLDLCDERGILFIEEIPLWGYSASQLAHDILSDRAAAMVWAMVERDVNHPCIWAWSVLNECATDTTEGELLVERLVDTVREVDRTRPVTYATDRAEADRCLHLVDLVCLNAYHGWYRDDETWPRFLDRMRALVGNKPMLVTEFGAGGIYGWHTLEEGVIWSEEYQAALLSDCITTFEERHDLVGYYVWQFFDTRSDRGARNRRALGRPRSYNNKGLLNEYRQPKLAYHQTRELLARRNKP